MGQWWQTARGNPVFHLTVILALGVLVLDQATKMWILHGLDLDGRLSGHIDLSPIFDLTYVENRGVSFGLFAGGMTSRVLFSGLAIIVAVYVLHWSGTLQRRWAALGGGFIVGGAIGNAIDRIAYGYVVDFLDFSGAYFPWVFNVADMAINVGVALLAYDAFFLAPKSEAAKSLPAGDGPRQSYDPDGEGPPPPDDTLTGDTPR